MTEYNTVTEAGSLVVFTISDCDEYGIAKPRDGYYWTDKHENSPQGPFSTVYSAMQDHIEVLEWRQGSKSMIPYLVADRPEAEVIRVDFVLKGRIVGAN